jgi:hypothetical protein
MVPESVAAADPTRHIIDLYFSTMRSLAVSA